MYVTQVLCTCENIDLDFFLVTAKFPWKLTFHQFDDKIFSRTTSQLMDTYDRDSANFKFTSDFISDIVSSLKFN